MDVGTKIMGQCPWPCFVSRGAIFVRVFLWQSNV